jgi:hypothetical protein
MAKNNAPANPLRNISMETRSFASRMFSESYYWHWERLGPSCSGIKLGERALTPALPYWVKATPWALRMSAVTGSSFGARGTLSSFRPASCGRRLPSSVHVLARPHEIFPRVLATARAGRDVVEAAFLRLEQLAGVLATVAVAIANRLRAELRALLRHLGEVHGDNNRRHTDWAARGDNLVRTAPARPPSKGGVLLVRRPGNELALPSRSSKQYYLKDDCPPFAARSCDASGKTGGVGGSCNLTMPD